MARSNKTKMNMTSSDNKGSKIRPMKSGSSAPSPLMGLGKKSYAKRDQSAGAQQFDGSMPSFGLTGMTGED